MLFIISNFVCVCVLYALCNYACMYIYIYMRDDVIALISFKSRLNCMFQQTNKQACTYTQK